MRDGTAARVLKTILIIIAIFTVNAAVSVPTNQPDSSLPSSVGSNAHGGQRKFELAQLNAQRKTPSEVKRYVQASVANLRQRPDVESEIVAKLPIKTEVTVYEEASSWALVGVNEDRGWISSSLLIDRPPTVGVMYEGLVEASRAGDRQLEKVYAERAAALAPNSIKVLEALIRVLQQAGKQAALEKAKRGLAQAWERQYRLGSFIDPEEFLAQTRTKNAKPNRQVTVSNAKELIGALAPNTTILLRPGRYIFKNNAASGKLSNLSPYYDGRIHDLEGLALVGLGPEPAIILESERTSPALTFDRISNLRLANLAIGHQPDLGVCMGSVLHITASKNIFISHASLFGSGTQGLTLENVDQLTLEDSAISNCSEGLSTINNSNAIHFKRVDITNNVGIYKGFLLKSSDLSIVDSRIYNNDVTEFGEAIPRSWTESPFYFKSLPDVCSDEAHVRSAEFEPSECRESHLRLANTSVEGDIIDRKWQQDVPDLIDPNCGYRRCSPYQPNCGVEDYDCIDSEYSKVIQSIQDSSENLVSQHSGMPDTFMGKASSLEGGAIEIVFSEHYQNKEFITNLENICRTSHPDNEIYFIRPRLAEFQFNCVSTAGWQGHRLSITVEYDGGNAEDRIKGEPLVIISTVKKEWEEAWKKRELTEAELNQAKSFQMKHTGREYTSPYSTTEELSFMLETRLGDFMFFPVVDRIGEFVVPQFLVIREVEEGRWQEVTLASEGRPVYDFDGDGFPEFEGGTQYELKVWSIYPQKGLLLRASGM